MNSFRLLVLCAIIHVAYAVPATLGSASSVNANTVTTLNYNAILGPDLVISVDQNANVTLSSYTTIATALPPGFQSLSFGAQIGFTLQISPANANIVSATLTTPALSLTSINIITGTVSAGCLQYNGTFYNQVDANFSPTAYQYTLPLPSVGTYVFVGVNQNATIPSFYGVARRIVQNVQTSIRYAGNFLISVNANANSQLTVTQSSTSTFSDPANYTNIGTFWNIELNTQASLNANFTYAYDEAVVAAKGIVENTLRFAYYQATTGWTFDGTASIDVSANTITQNTNHFSQWGAFGRQSESTTSSSSTGSSSSSSGSTGSTTNISPKLSFSLAVLLVTLLAAF